MSFRFGADGTANSRVTRTGGAPDPQGAGGWTMCGWFYLSTDRNDFSTMFRAHASSGSTTRLTLATKTDGTTPAVFTPGNTGGVTGVDAFTVGSWLFIAVVQSGTTATIYTCTPGGTMHSASGTSSGGSAPDGYTIGGRSASDNTEWFSGRARDVRQWSGVQLTPTELAAERDSFTAVKAGAYSDHPLATGTDLSDVSGNTRTLTAGSAAGTTEADPPLGSTAADTLTGIRVGALADVPAATLVLADGVGAARVGGTSDVPAVGLTAFDTLGGARAASLTDTAAVGVAAPDVPGAARTSALPDTLAVGTARADVVGGVRVAGLPESVANGLVLPDLLGGVRAYGLPDTSVTALQLPDPLGSVRIGGPAEAPSGTLILLDVIGHVRVGPLADVAAAGLTLADQLGAVRVVGLPNPLAPPAFALPVPLGVVRVAALTDTASGGTPAGSRDITVSARLLPARHTASVLPSRWTVTEV